MCAGPLHSPGIWKEVRVSRCINTIESREPSADVVRKARLTELAIRWNIDSNLNLFANDLLDCLTQLPVEFTLIVGLPAILRADVSPKFLWPRKTANMGRQDPFRTSFHGILVQSSDDDLVHCAVAIHSDVKSALVFFWNAVFVRAR